MIQVILLRWFNILEGGLMIPSSEQLKNKILCEFHISKVDGHVGITKTIARVTSQCFFQRCN